MRETDLEKLATLLEAIRVEPNYPNSEEDIAYKDGFDYALLIIKSLSDYQK